MAALLPAAGLAQLSSQATYIANVDPQVTPTRFGVNVDVVGDLDGDGLNDLLIGANFWDDPTVQNPGGRGIAQNVGRAYVVSSADSSLIYPLDDPSNVLGEIMFGKYGRAVGIGDVNGDGLEDVLTSSYWRTLNGAHPGIAVGGAGQAFVHDGADGTVLYTLDDPSPEMLALFGCYLADLGDLDGDGVSEAGVTNPLHNSEINNVGEVHIYRGADGALLATVANPDPTSNGRFGLDLMSLGDVNQDDRPEFVVGAPGQGRAYVFDGATQSVLHTLQMPGADQVGPKFGRRVAAGVDLNGNGSPDLAIAAPTYDLGQMREYGQVFLFDGGDGSALGKLDHTAGAFSQFGLALGLVDDLDGDGRGEIVVGAPDANVDGVIKGGVALVFNVDGDVLLELHNPVPETYAHFGGAIGSGDVDGDGYPEVVVGAPHQDLVVVEVSSQTGRPLLNENDEEAIDLWMEQGAVTVFHFNAAPVAVAGEPFEVAEGAMVELDGAASFDPNGDSVRYRWRQLEGPPVQLFQRVSPTPAFTAPLVDEDTVLSFELTVSDDEFSTGSEVLVTVLEVAS